LRYQERDETTTVHIITCSVIIPFIIYFEVTCDCLNTAIGKVTQNTGRFIMFSVITNIYNKKAKGPTLMELFTVTGKKKKGFFGC
jgi:hypothetical protein